jgi:lysophospholipase L1-like esterase
LRIAALIALIAVVGCGVIALGQARSDAPQPRGTQKWVTSWNTSMHGPYPSGNPSAQPSLEFAIESAAEGAVDQTMRLIVKPDLWGRVIRLRFSNTFGTRAITFDDVFVGLHGGAASVVSGTNRPLTFAEGKSKQLTLAPGASAWSDPVTLPWVPAATKATAATAAMRSPAIARSAAAGSAGSTSAGAISASSANPLIDGRKLAVSFHIVGASGPMTWHAKALTTSYLTPPRSGSHGDDDDTAFPYSTTSWFFMDRVDVMAAPDTAVIACFGDSITDGTLSTLNGDDRWPDVLSRRLHAKHGDRVSIVNAGIGGNRIISPATYSIDAPIGGGPSALERLDRDVLSLSGLTAIVWLEGINDLAQGASADEVIAGMREVARRVQAKGGITLIAATLTSGVGSTTPHGTPDAEARRQAINTFIRTSGIFAGVADFDAATRDESTGGLRAAFVPNSTIGGPGDRLHPNRAGYLAMGQAIDLMLLAPK